MAYAIVKLRPLGAVDVFLPQANRNGSFYPPFAAQMSPHSSKGSIDDKKHRHITPPVGAAIGRPFVIFLLSHTPTVGDCFPSRSAGKRRQPHLYSKAVLCAILLASPFGRGVRAERGRRGLMRKPSPSPSVTVPPKGEPSGLRTRYCRRKKLLWAVRRTFAPCGRKQGRRARRARRGCGEAAAVRRTPAAPPQPLIPQNQKRRFVLKQTFFAVSLSCCCSFPQLACSWNPSP